MPEDRRLPEWLTVEEAAAYLRVGRTKAYAMTREWRATGGASGLPCVDFGNLLRVSRSRLEQLADAGPAVPASASTDVVAPQVTLSVAPTPLLSAPKAVSAAADVPRMSRSSRRSSRRRASSSGTNQGALFDLPVDPAGA